jgi:NAD(P)-dependent dehydrogenase (short-subunit alcohol dehydrogenase family)
VVTGAAQGIGAAIARRVASTGGHVAVLDRQVERGAAVASEIDGLFVEVDLSDAEDTRRAMTVATEKLGGVDVLVNNAGILLFGSVLDLTIEDWDRTFAINTRPMLLTLQHAARLMIAQGSGGRIVNMSSMAAKTGGGGQAHYAASKAAVAALTRAAAEELGCHGITVNCVCPGYVLTEMGAATRTAADVEAWSSKSPLHRLAEAEDVAGVVAFLCGPDGGYLTGQSMNVTGGMITH